MAGLLRRGSSGPDVKELQALLNAHTADKPLNVDGIFGPLTEERVKAFQRSVGIKDDGLVGPNTREELSHGAEISIRLDLYRLLPARNVPAYMCPYLVPIPQVFDPQIAHMLGVCSAVPPHPLLRFPPRTQPAKVEQPQPAPIKPVKDEPGYNFGASAGAAIDFTKLKKVPSSMWIDLQLKVPFPKVKNLSSTFTLSPNYDFAKESFGITASTKVAYKYKIFGFGDIGKLTGSVSGTGAYDVDFGKSHNVSGKALKGFDLTFGKGTSAIPYVTFGLGLGGKGVFDFDKQKFKFKGVVDGSVRVGWHFR